MRCALVLLLVLSGCGETTSCRPPAVLFVSQSAGYQHEVVKRHGPRGLSFAEAQMMKACEAHWGVHLSQDAAADIHASNLAMYDAVIFYTTGELPISAENRTALLDYIRDGGAFIGIHPATDTFYKWPEYGEMIGAYFDGHPWHQKVKVRVEDRDHPATKHLGWHFEITDEIYQFKNYDRSKLQVLMSIDVESIDLKAKGVKRWDGDFAVSWCKPYGKGRVFYTSLGHRKEVWADERFLKHLVGGIQWAIGP